LLPAPGRERGLVKWYNHRKRYGFLVRRDHPEIFAHGSDLQDARSLRPGDLVEFSVASGERGPAAKELTVIDHGEPPIPD
jgi:CspA family cold shock protein